MREGGRESDYEKRGWVMKCQESGMRKRGERDKEDREKWGERERDRI